MHGHKINWTPDLIALSRHWWALQTDILMLEFLQTLHPNDDRSQVILLNRQELYSIAMRFWELHNLHCQPQEIVALDDIIPPPPPPPPEERFP